MRLKLSFFAVVCHLICICAAGETESKAIAAVYYETYCPDSVKFINTQLYPTYQKLNGSYFTPHMQPFGRANFSTLPNGTVTFTCQHGEKECYGNKVHACVLSLADLLPAKLKFINCSMARTDLKNPNPHDYPIDVCAAESQINAQEIKTCLLNTSFVDSLLMTYGNETKKFSIPSFPYIMFDGKFDNAVSKESEQNLGAVICKTFIPANDTKYDAVCKSPNSSATTLAFTAFPVIVLTFVFSKLY